MMFFDLLLFVLFCFEYKHFVLKFFDGDLLTFIDIMLQIQFLNQLLLLFFLFFLTFSLILIPLQLGVLNL